MLRDHFSSLKGPASRRLAVYFRNCQCLPDLEKSGIPWRHPERCATEVREAWQIGKKDSCIAEPIVARTKKEMYNF